MNNDLIRAMDALIDQGISVRKYFTFSLNFKYIYIYIEDAMLSCVICILRLLIVYEDN